MPKLREDDKKKKEIDPKEKKRKGTWRVGRKRLEEHQESQTKYGKIEQEIVLQFFERLIDVAPEVLFNLEKIVSSNQQNELCSSLLDLATATGKTFSMLEIVIENEFIKSSKDDPGSIMRGNCLASKLINLFLLQSGTSYLESLLGAFINEMLDSEKSFELDPNRLDNPSKELEVNKISLLDKVRSLVQHITSQDMIDALPLEMKIIASYLAQYADIYAPDQFYALIGGFLFLRYINPALLSPDFYGLAEKAPTDVARRNLIIVTKILQNLSNGLEFGQKEPFMVCLNDYIKANTWRLEKYFQAIVSLSPSVPDQVKTGVCSLNSIDFFYKLITQHSEEVLSNLLPETSHEFWELIEKLKQYRHLDKFFEKKYSNDQSATIRIVVNVEDQIYEQTLDTTAQFIQPLVQNLVQKIQKHDQKSQRKKEKKTEKRIKDTKIFGKRIRDLVDQQKTNSSKVPEFLSNSVSTILLKGLSVDRIFQDQGDKHLLDQMKSSLDSGESVNFSKIDDIHSICALIKTFFRELPDPFFPENLVKNVESTWNPTASRDENITKLKVWISLLPETHFQILKLILRLLWEISENSRMNGMTSFKLSLEFSPLWFPTISGSELVLSLVETLISCYPKIFEESINQEDEQKLTLGPVLKRRLVAHKKSIQTINELSPNSIAVASSNLITIWDTHSYKLDKEMKIDENNGQVLAMVTVSPEQVWYSTNKCIQVWDIKSNSIKCTIPQGSSSLVRVNNYVWSNSLTQNFVFQFDIEDPKKMRKFQMNEEKAPLIPHMWGLGSNVWGGTISGSIFIWDALSNQFLKELPQAHKKKITSFVEVEQHVWSASDDGTINVWNKNNFQHVKTIQVHSGKVKHLAAINREVWVCNWDMSVKVYSSQSFTIIYELKEHLDVVSCAIFLWNSEKQKWFAWTSSYDCTLCIWMLPDPGTITTKFTKSLKTNEKKLWLESQWLYNGIDRSTAEQLLASTEENTFLVRPSTTKNCFYALSRFTAFNQEIDHFILESSSEGYLIQDSPDTRHFKSLGELVNETTELKGFIPLGATSQDQKKLTTAKSD